MAPPLDTDAFIKAHGGSVARSGQDLDLCCGNVVEQPPRSWKQFQNIDERMMKLLISFFKPWAELLESVRKVSRVHLEVAKPG